MALVKYQMNVTDETKTIVSDYTSLIFNLLLYNKNDTESNYTLYIDNGITLFSGTLQPNETKLIKPEILLNNETLKIYVTGSVDLAIQFLNNN